MALAVEAIDFVTLNEEIIGPANEEMEKRMLPAAYKRFRVLSSKDYDFDKANPDLFDQPFKDIVAFVALNESKPPTEKLLAAADRCGAFPLRVFITDIWGPEEGEDLAKGGHGEVLGEAAVAYEALSRQQLNDERAEMFQRYFSLGEGYGGIQANAYGEGQERFTQGFYTFMLDWGIRQIRALGVKTNTLPTLKAQERKELIRDNPILQVFQDLIPQEAFHGSFYREYLKAILKSIKRYNPRLVDGFISTVAQTFAELQMPGRVMVPDRYEDIHNKSGEFGFSVFFPLKHIAHDLRPIIGYKGLGEAVLGYVGNDPENLIPEKFDKLRPVARGLHRINNPWVNSVVGWRGMKYVSQKAV